MGMNENINGCVGGRGKYMRVINSEEHLQEIEQRLRQIRSNEQSSSSGYVHLCTFLSSINSILLGYDIGVMSGVIVYIQKDLHVSEFQQEILVGCLSIISLFGSLAGGKTSDLIGRKWTMGIAAIVFQIGGLIMALAPSFLVLILGRLLSGIGIGFGIMIVPVYIAEISPSTIRGSLTSFPEIFINIGILLGYISNYVFSGFSEHISWRLMLGVSILPSVLLGFALFIIPESPRWLIMQNRGEEARLVLHKIMDKEKDADLQLAAITEAATTKNEEKQTWHEFINPSPCMRKMLITGCGIQCFQQITGIDATVYYSPAIFKNAGVKSDKEILMATIAVGFVKTIFILVAICLIDSVGRKPLLYISTIGMTLCLLTLSATLSLHFGVTLAIFAVCGNVAFFSMGIGPICWVLTSEVFPLRLRAQASAVGAIGSRISSGVITMSFLSVARAISVGGVFLVFSAISALSVVFVYKYVPETMGKSLEEIELLFRDVGEGGGGEVEMREAKSLSFVHGDL